MQRQPRNSENVPLVAHRRKHFQGFLVVLFCCLTHFKNPYFMMIISFIAVKDGLVPWMEGVCSSNPYAFEFSVLRSHFLHFFFGRKNMLKEKKQLVQDLILPPSIYIHMCTSYKYMVICILRFSPSGLFGLSKWLTSEYPTCSVCVCVGKTHTNTYTPTPVKNRKNTDNALIYPSVKNEPPCPHQVPCID